MRKTTLRQLEVLEREERSYQRKHQSSLETLAFLCWKVLLAYHLGDLELDEQDPGEAEARALKYDSRYDYLEALFNGGIGEINERFKEAARCRLLRNLSRLRPWLARRLVFLLGWRVRRLCPRLPAPSGGLARLRPRRYLSPSKTPPPDGPCLTSRLSSGVTVPISTWSQARRAPSHTRSGPFCRTPQATG